MKFSVLLLAFGSLFLMGQNAYAQVPTRCIDVLVIVEGGGDQVVTCEGDGIAETIDFTASSHAMPVSFIITDENKAYLGIGDHDTKHESVNHSQKEWVKAGDIHTNGIENVWSLLKRSVIGTYHKVSKKHLDAYLDELEWRINNRDNKYLFRDTLKKLLESKNVEYQELVAS